MAIRITRDQQKAVKTICGFMFLGALTVAGCLAYYTYRNSQGDSADGLIDLLAFLMRREDRVSDATRIIIAALPALAVAVSVKRQGVLSRFGWFGVIVLSVTFLLSTAAFIGADPRQDSPVSMDVATSVLRQSQDLSKFALTYIFMLLGLSMFSTASDEK